METDDQSGASEQRDDGYVVTHRLNHLFDTVHPRNRGPYQAKEVVRAINEKAGREVLSTSYLSRIRSGERPNPSHAVVAALADFFGVPLDYFADDHVAKRVNDQLELAKALQDSGVAAMATRAAGLSEASLRTIMAVIESERMREQLPEDGH